MSEEIIMPKWNDDEANRKMYPDDFDINTGREFVYNTPIYLSRSQRRYLDSQRITLSLPTLQATMKYLMFRDV